MTIDFEYDVRLRTWTFTGAFLSAFVMAMLALTFGAAYAGDVGFGDHLLAALSSTSKI